MGRFLGIDYGEKRIGVSVSDPTGTIASPFRTLLCSSGDDALLRLQELINSEKIEGVVVGLPIGMKGQDTEQTKLVQLFVERLRRHLDLPIHTADERLTSVAAKNVLKEQKIQPSRNKAMVDSTAAALILQSFLDKTK
ncbi:MAG: Holliday junction resolvase RuvX [Candidatus Marinimicrobia bacterium]|nr:Holliday junction resolvase RuvX [Candidatus Neomarinimicrobiota bacterium]|tara:strand:- start:26031 stop:26444 length:414 start_codon:yes stop_codon:yes gene_type:complete